MKNRNVLKISLDRREDGKYVSAVYLEADQSTTDSAPKPDIKQGLVELIGKLVLCASPIAGMEAATLMLEELEEKSNAAKPN